MTSPFQDALREELRAAARRDVQRAPGPRRGRVAAIGAAVAAVVAALAGAIAILLPSPAGADVEVRVHDGVVEVRLKDLDTTATEVRQALRDRGLAVHVDDLPVGPSLVGRFVGVTIADDPGAPIEQLSEAGKGFTGFRVHEGWTGQLVVTVGRAAKAGEAYGAGSDAFAVGEPLHCSGLLGATLATAEAHVGDLRVDVLPDGRIGGPLPVGSPELAPDAGWFVHGARATAADHVILQIGPAAPTAPPERC